ncbi:MAG: CAP domain-containing protein [Kofleriaceae bacterium]
MRALILALALAGAAVAAWQLWPRDRGAAPTTTPATARHPRGPDATPGDADARTPSTLPPGTELELTLLAPAATTYSTRRPAADDGHRLGERLARQASRAGAELRADANLAQAARELALQAARLGELPPESVLGVLLHAAGAPDVSASVHLTQADERDPDAYGQTVDDALAHAPRGAGPIRIGVAEIATDDLRRGRTLVALVARADVELDGVPTTAQPGAPWRARVTPVGAWRELHALALGPRGEPVEVTLTEHAGALELTMTAPAGADGEQVAVAIDGVGPDGPGKLMQLTVWLGAAVPATHRVVIVGDDPPDLDELDAAEHAFALLEADRARLGAPPLARDVALDAIAHAHSVDMRDGGFFGHRSPRTGLAGDRLRAAGYRASAHGENLARNDRLAEAEASLVASLGHRANIADPRFTVVGLGAVADADGQWYLTQLFARPAPRLDDGSPARLATRADDARAAAGLGPLTWRPELAAAAAAVAPQLATSSVEQVTSALSTAVQPHLRGGASLWVATGVDPEEMALPEAALAPAARGVGLALWQDPSDGTVGVVLVVENR